jgi:hypothetical protein
MKPLNNIVIIQFMWAVVGFLSLLGAALGTCNVPAQFNPSIDPTQESIISNALIAFQDAIVAESSHMFGGLSVGLVYGERLFWTKGFGLINMSDPTQGTPDEGLFLLIFFECLMFGLPWSIHSQV